ncbi:MAG: dTDP-4-dehydrorhamnose reductase [Gemmatimonadetes bacterium]|nr:dTDP-4-dehydrorhamnose reductase [Gemmatimonadota bacterium]
MTGPAHADGARVKPVAALELWGGFECTINRVGDRQHDQCAFTGHYDRLDDIDRVASLGVRTVRYPVLWERFADARCEDEVWRATDARLARMRELGLDPVIGLVHHGSGPRATSLLHADFAHSLAHFARRVAERYPWVTRFTPINEPLTTARFSALYGLWYPHLRDDAAFFRAILNQVRGIRLAMAAIREVTPAATLVQTEDLGRTHSTPPLAYQADLENERRWLTGDLLTLRVRDGHAMYARMLEVGVSEGEVADATGDGCTPDILGINIYVTSERWLDHRTSRYPRRTHGDNGTHRYADVEAVRGRVEGLAGHEALLMEAWHRYRLPMAVTEVHLGCTREEQMRWLHDAWRSAARARGAGADIRAVTAWAMLGLQDWSSLITRIRGHYESGAFDVRAPVPRPTALATMIRSIATTGTFNHPVLAGPGWWRRPSRLAYLPGGETERVNRTPVALHHGHRPVLVIGASGTLGRATLRLCDERGLAAHPVCRPDADVADPQDVERLLRASGAWAVVNAAGYVRVDDAEREAAPCWHGNVTIAAALADACAARGVPLVTYSSDLVFDGRKGGAYFEGDAVGPLNAYGRSKAEAESRVLQAHPGALVIRTAAFFGPWDDWNFVSRSLASLAQGDEVLAADDLFVSPTYVPDLVHASLDLLLDGERGVWHLANAGRTSWASLARQAADAARIDASRVCGRPHAELRLAARRPADVALASERGWLMPTLENALARYVRARPWKRLQRQAPASPARTFSAA